MRTSVLTLLCFTFLLYSSTHAEERNTYKQDVTLWYEAFNTKAPALLDRILSEHWVDIPAAPDQPAGPAGVKPLLAQLTTTFPDLHLTIKDMLQDGDKVIVRAEMAGTQREAFLGLPTKNRTMTIKIWQRTTPVKVWVNAILTGSLRACSPQDKCKLP